MIASEMRRIAFLSCLFVWLLVASGCKFPEGGSTRRDCSKVLLDSAAIHTSVMAASGENGFDLRPYARVLDEFGTLGKECKLPAGDLGDLRVKIERAEADKNVTHDELRPVVTRMDELVASATGKPVAVTLVLNDKGELVAPPPDIKAGNCPLPERRRFDDFPFRYRALKDAPAAEVAAAAKVDEASQSAGPNLVALAEAQVRYHAKNGTYLAFTNGDDATWTTLGVRLWRTAHHSYSAGVTKDGFRILAEANLDGDPFTDRWLIEYKTGAKGCPEPAVLAGDSIDATFEDGPARLVRNTDQPKMKLP